MCESTMSSTPNSPVTNTSPPLPAFFSHAERSFILKKRRPAFSSLPTSTPSSPSHLGLPARPSVREHSHLRKSVHQPHSIWKPLSNSLIKSPPQSSLYNPSNKLSYFKQCFTNLGLLGRGSFGEVYKVRSNKDRRHYAIKRSAKRFRGHRERDRNVREARYHELLSPHPHIVDFVAAWEERDRMYIQTELCSTSLLHHAESQPDGLDDAAVWAYLCDLLSALQHLHSHSFVHLDLKPANILITDSGRVKLGDFGLLHEVKTTNTMETKGEDFQEGDPRYLAPELLRGVYGPAADVFSLGVSILELACNLEIPNGGEGWQQLRQGVLPSEFTKGLSDELLAVLEMMLVPEPSERATVSELLSLPSVRKQRWRRQVHLLVAEAIQTLVSLYQWVVSFGCNVLAYFRLPSLPQWNKPPPSTPPMNKWDENLTLAHNAMYSDSDCSEEEASLESAVDFSPLLKPAKSRLFLKTTSTPLPDLPMNLRSDPGTPIHFNNADWSSGNLTGTPSSVYAHDSFFSLPVSSGSRWSSSNKSYRQHGHNPNPEMEEPLNQSNFKPKNLISLFDTIIQEEQR